MKKTQDLFDLIQRLSRSEKRYFTLDARKAGKRESRYLLLFQAINQQESYDEAALKKKFKGNLADDKARLYEAILRSMRDFRSHRSSTARMKELLLDANFLYERGLYQQCQKRLAEAKEIATELQDQLSGLEINREQRRIVNTLGNQTDRSDLQLLQTEAQQQLQLLQEEVKFLDTHDELIRAVHRLRQSNETEQQQALHQQYATRLLSTEPPTSLRAQLRFYQSRAMLAQLEGKAAGVYENFLQVNQLWEANPAYKQEEFNRYLDDAFNLLHATFQYPAVIAQAATLLDRLAAEQPDSAHDRLVLFQRTATYRLIYTINFAATTPAEQVLGPIQEGLQLYDLHPVSELTIRYNAAVLFFLQAKPLDCENWLLSIIELRRNELRPDIVQAARLLRILTLLDQDMDPDFLDAQIRAEQRLLTKASPSQLIDFSKWMLRNCKKELQLLPSAVAGFRAQQRQELPTTWPQLPLGLNELIEQWYAKVR